MIDAEKATEWMRLERLIQQLPVTGESYWPKAEVVKDGRWFTVKVAPALAAAK